MKKLTFALALAVMLGHTSAAFAGSSISTASVPVTASVDQVLTLDMTIVPENPDGTLSTTPVTSMPYTLVRDGSNALAGNVAYHVFLGANTSARPYFINSTVGNLVSGANTLPNAWGVFPVQATSDGTADITGDSLAADQSAVGTDKRIYDSNTAGSGAVLELVYGISGGNADGSAPFTGWQPIPPDQASGTYTASPALTFTLTTTV